MKSRRKWLSDIYMDMTGTPPPDALWDTPSGQMISENNPAFLYDQPTANLYQIVYELPAEIRAEIFRLIRAMEENIYHQALTNNDSSQNDKELFKHALTRSTLRVSPYAGTARPLRYIKSANQDLQSTYKNLLLDSNAEELKKRFSILRRKTRTRMQRMQNITRCRVQGRVNV